MKEKNYLRYLRFLLVLIPLIPGFVFSGMRGFRFSAFVCFAISALVLVFCVITLIPGKAAKIVRNILIVLVVIGLILAIATEIYVVSGSHGTPGECEYLIVLGAGLRGREPSLILQDRLNTAADYLAEHPDVICIVSGGQGPGEDITEAECMAEILEDRGISPDRIWRENKSTSTAENIRFSLQVIEDHTGEKPETVGVLSNEFHLRRAELLIHSHGVNAVGFPAKTSWTALKINYYIREIASLWFYILFGFGG